MPLIRRGITVLPAALSVVIRPGSITYLCVFMLLLQVACSDPDAERNEALRNEINTVHDETMVQTGYLFDLQTRLEALEPPTRDSQQRAAELIEALETADRTMFRWMNQYQILAVEGDIEADNDYRREQLEAIRSISRQTDQAISDARTFLTRAGAVP